MQTTTKLLLIVSLVTLACGNCLFAEEKSFLTGSEKALWLIKNQSKGYHVLLRPSAKRWKMLLRETRGNVISATAVGSQLFLLLENNLNRRLDTKAMVVAGTKCDHENWPADEKQLVLTPAGTLRDTPPAGAEAVTEKDTKSNPFIIVAVVPRAVEPKTPATKADESGDSAITSPVIDVTKPVTGRDVILGVFAYTRSEWQFLGDVGEAQLQPTENICAIVLDGKLHVMIAGGDKNRLFTWAPGQVKTVELQLPAESSRILALLNHDDKLAMAALVTQDIPDAKGKTRLELMILDPDSSDIQRLPITKDDMDFPFSDVSPIPIPLLTNFAGDIALIWQEEDSWRFGIFRRDGKFLPSGSPGDLTEVDMSGVESMQMYLVGAVIITLLLTLFVARPKSPVMPFSLPESVRCGNLPKRLLAGIIDLIICTIPSMVIFAPDLTNKSSDIFDIQAMTSDPTSLYAAMVTVVIFIASSALLEWRLGATIGKKLMKLKVVGSGGIKATGRECVLRNVVKYIELSFPPFVPVLLAVPLLNRYRLRFGDIIARTVVVDATSC